MSNLAHIEEKEAQEINEGRKANELLEDPLFKAAYNEIRDQALKDFENSEPDQKAIRDEAYYRLRGMKDIERVLKKKKSRGATAMQKRSRRTKKETN